MAEEGLESTLKTNYIDKKKKKRKKKMATSLVLPEHKLESHEKGLEGVMEDKPMYLAEEPDPPMSVYKKMSTKEKAKEAVRYFKKKSKKDPKDKTKKKHAKEAVESYIKIKKMKGY